MDIGRQRPTRDLHQNPTAPSRHLQRLIYYVKLVALTCEDFVQTRMLRPIAIVAACFCSGAFATADEGPRHAPKLVHGTSGSSQPVVSPRSPVGGPRLKTSAARTPAADRDPYADPASPYKANRLSWSREPILNIPGQTTVLTRQILDDTNATSLRDALGSAAGVTIGR
jgi:hypothetical protein